MDQKITTIELVINTEYGGFSYNQEIAEWLKNKRKWKIITEKELGDEHPLTTIIKLGSNHYATYKDCIELRMHKDLVNCIRELKEKHEDDDFTIHHNQLDSLEIKTVSIFLDIEDYHDGKERVKTYTGYDK